MEEGDVSHNSGVWSARDKTLLGFKHQTSGQGHGEHRDDGEHPDGAVRDVDGLAGKDRVSHCPGVRDVVLPVYADMHKFATTRPLVVEKIQIAE